MSFDPTPEQIEGYKQAVEERKKRCNKLSKRYINLFEEEIKKVIAKNQILKKIEDAKRK